ncbi:MAG: GSCFA domain-containing protein [Alistipes sp.]|nr:GSCFA domain-containing protein [Alistipes sp.]
MKFRTELKIAPFPRPIGYRDSILSMGSCFADEVGQRLCTDKFRATCNPLGTLFNPLSIWGLLERAAADRPFTEEEVQHHPSGSTFLFGLPTRFTATESGELLCKANEALRQTRRCFEEANHLIVTFGTAYIYRLTATGEVVANCHKQPHDLFRRERLTVNQIVEPWVEFIKQYPDKQFILTVSPIRHLGDGLEGNAISKSILRLAVEQLAEQLPNVRYFPAYELLLDDLRDYRFYADDLCHPSRQAVEYIYEKFAEAAFTPETLALQGRLRALTAFAAHRPFDPSSGQYRSECLRHIERMEEEERANNLDFSAEIALLKGRL